MHRARGQDRNRIYPDLHQPGRLVCPHCPAAPGHSLGAAARVCIVPKPQSPPPSAHASAMLSHSHSPPGPGGALRSSAVCSAAPLGGTLQGCSRFRSTRCYGNGMAQIALPCVHRPEPEPALSDVARKVRRGVAQHTTAKPSAMRATAGPHRHYCHCPLPTAHRPPPTASGAVPLPLPLTLPVYLALAPGPCRRTNSRRRPWAMT